MLAPIPLKSLLLPASRLSSGDRILVLATPGAVGESGSAPAAGGQGSTGITATVYQVSAPDQTGDATGAGSHRRPTRGRLKMTIIARVGAGGSPGVTTTALGLTLTWPRDVILAECDPAGGSLLGGLWRGQAAGSGRGMLIFALASQRDPEQAAAAVQKDAVALSDTAGGPGR